ncbi:MAG: hypothetical protein ACRCT8_13270 [Lacipirellulaceae bacterium]
MTLRPLTTLSLLAAAMLPGCAQWEAARYNLSRLQDDRVADIESRLDRSEPVVASPFGAAKEKATP